MKSPQRKMPPLRSALRAYSIACAAMVLLLFPGFVASFGKVRQHPLELRERADVADIAFGDGEWLPARGIAAARLIAAIPPGMRVCYRFTNGSVQCGEVVDAAEAPARTMARGVTAVLALAFALSGALLALIGIDRRAHAAAGMLAGIGLLFGADFLEPALVAIGNLRAELAVLALWEWFPRYAALLCILVFAREFPATLPRSRFVAALLSGFTVLVIVATVIDGIAHTPGLVDRTSPAAQAAVISLVLLNQKLVYAGAALGTIVLAMLQRKHAAAQPAQVRRRGRMVATAIAFGLVPTMLLGLLQVIFRLLLGRRLIPIPLVTLSFVTMLAVPAAVMAGVTAKRIDPARILVRRAVLFVVADRVLLLLKIAPFAALALLLYIGRDRSIRSLVADHPIALAMIAAAAVLLFGFSERIRRAVQTTSSPERLGALPSLVARAETVEAVARVVERELEVSLDPESVALFVFDEREQAFRAVTSDLPRLAGTSVIASALHAPRSATELREHALDETDRDWLTVTGTEILVPVVASDRQLLAVLAIGEKSSTLPFSDSEKAALMTIASACALTIENHRLRSIRAPAVIARRSDLNPGAVCPSCNRYYHPSVAARCPIDDTELEDADVPYVLAGKYRFEQRLGAGGMGIVYRARDLPLERDVAVKTLPRLSEDMASRLRREARTAANLLHPNLATVFAVETWRGVPMLILEYLDDGTLADHLSRGPLAVETIVRCGTAIAEALGHVHARTILHRDVKPSNIGFSRGGGAKLLDFGLARLLEESTVPAELLSDTSPQPLTVTSGVVGTPAYLSPEAILGEPPHPDFDLWSLSLTLYEATTGRNPFADTTVTATMNAILAKDIPDPRDLRRDCPAGLSRFLIESLSRHRETRPRSATELASRLHGAVGV